MAKKKQTNRVIVADYCTWVANLEAAKLDAGSTRIRYQTGSSVYECKCLRKNELSSIIRGNKDSKELVHEHSFWRALQVINYGITEKGIFRFILADYRNNPGA